MAQVIVEIDRGGKSELLLSAHVQGVYVEGVQYIDITQLLGGQMPIILRPGDSVTIRHLLPEAEPQ